VKYGDVMAKLARGETLSTAEINFIQAQGNVMQSNNAVLGNWMQPGGNLDANLFSQYSNGFTILPHECAMIYQSGNQSIPDDTDTTLTGYSATSGATLSDGLKIDPTNGRIYVSGIARDTWIILYAWGTFEANNSGDFRRLQICADDTSCTEMLVSPVQNRYTPLWKVHIRSLPSTQTYYYVRAKQDSGGALNIGGYGFAIARIR